MSRGSAWIALPLLLGAVGCSSTKPCMIIPAQVELAESDRDAALAELESRQRDLDRWSHALEQSRARLERLIEDRDKLRAEVGDEEAEEGR